MEINIKINSTYFRSFALYTYHKLNVIDCQEHILSFFIISYICYELCIFCSSIYILRIGLLIKQ